MRSTPGMLMLTLVGAIPVSGQAPSTGDWQFSSDLRHSVVLPRTVSAKSLNLAYDDTATVVGLTVDLNHDGRADIIIRSGPDMCGASGNCSFAVLDGASDRRIGTIDGNTVIVRAVTVGGWPVFQTWWHGSATSGQFTTYVFDGRKYVTVTEVHLEGADVRNLFATIARIRPRPPGP